MLRRHVPNLLGHGDIMNKCNRCDKETTNSKFCSSSCAAIVNNKSKPKRKKKVRTCIDCSNEYTHDVKRSRYCKICKDKHSVSATKARTLSEVCNRNSVKGRHTSWVSSLIRQYGRTWNKKLSNGPCCECDYDLHVELCHIKPISDFSMSATLGEVNHPSNIIVLCRNCHWELDNGHLAISNK